METLEQLQEQYKTYKEMGLSLTMQRGQPGDNNFDLSNGILNSVTTDDLVSSSGIDLRNYPGGVKGLPEARQLFGDMLGVSADEMIVGNNSSLKLLSETLLWAMMRGLKNSPAPWKDGKVKIIVTVPGYDRHFHFLEQIGCEMVAVQMKSDGPDMDAVEKLALDPEVKGMLFVPIYSNPTGDTVSDEVVRRLAKMETAAPDFTIFADNAYSVHHLGDEKDEPINMLRACQEAGNADRIYLYGSTSKMTYASAGLGFMAASTDNIEYIARFMGAQFIGPNKVEQYRHVRFLNSYPGGIAGLMADHAALLKPKFDIVNTVLSRELGDSGLATWTTPKGGYFISLDTAKPVASRVVELAGELGVGLTPAGATYPHRHDPNNCNIRLSPSRPAVAEVEQAMEVVAFCVKLASIE